MSVPCTATYSERTAFIIVWLSFNLVLGRFSKPTLVSFLHLVSESCRHPNVPHSLVLECGIVNVMRSSVAVPSLYVHWFSQGEVAWFSVFRVHFGSKIASNSCPKNDLTSKTHLTTRQVRICELYRFQWQPIHNMVWGEVEGKIQHSKKKSSSQSSLWKT